MIYRSLTTALIVACGAFAESHAVAGTIFTETFESYTAGSVWATNPATNGDWRPFGVSFDGGDIVNTAPFAGQNIGQLNANGGVDAHNWNRFNPTSGSNLPTDPMWVEFFVSHDFTAVGQGWGLRIPTTNNISANRIQVGFSANDASSGTLFVSGAALGTTLSNFSLNDGQWAHVVAEYDFNGASSTVKVYAKQKTVGDTSALTLADELSLGGASTATFSWNGTIVDAMTIFNDFTNGDAATVNLDNIAVYTGTSPIAIPEPASVVLIGFALGLMGRRCLKP